jgi:hypothetical protein
MCNMPGPAPRWKSLPALKWRIMMVGVTESKATIQNIDRVAPKEARPEIFLEGAQKTSHTINSIVLVAQLSRSSLLYIVPKFLQRRRGGVEFEDFTERVRRPVSILMIHVRIGESVG